MSESRRLNKPGKLHYKPGKLHLEDARPAEPEDEDRSHLAYKVKIPPIPPVAAKQEAVGKKRGRQRRVLLDTDAFLPSQTPPLPSKSAPLSKSTEVERIPFTAKVLQPVDIAKEKRLQKKRDELETTMDLFSIKSLDDFGVNFGVNFDDKETNPVTQKMYETLELIYGLSDSLIKQIDLSKDEIQLFDDACLKILIELKNVVHALIPLHVKNTQKNQQECAEALEDFRVAISEYINELAPIIKEHAQLVANHVSGFITQKQHQLKPTQIEERGTNMASPRAKDESKITLAAAQRSITDILTSLTEAIDAKPYLETLVTQLDGLAYNIFTEILRLKKNDAIIRSESDFRSSISLQDTSSGLGLTDEQILEHEVGQRLIRLNTFLSPLSDVAKVNNTLVQGILATLPRRFPMSKTIEVNPPVLEEVKKPEETTEKREVKEPAGKHASASSSSSSSSNSESTEDDDAADNSAEDDAEEENAGDSNAELSEKSDSFEGSGDENKSATPASHVAAKPANDGDVTKLAETILRELGVEKMKEGDADSKSESSSSSSSSSSKKSGAKKAAKDDSKSQSGDKGTSSAEDALLTSEEKAPVTVDPTKAAELEAKKEEPAKAAAPEAAKSAPARVEPKADDPAEKPAESAKVETKAEEPKSTKTEKRTSSKKHTDEDKKEKLESKKETKPVLESESESVESEKSTPTKDDESTREEESTSSTKEKPRTKMPAMEKEGETSHRSSNKVKEKFNEFKKAAEKKAKAAKDGAEKVINKLTPKRELSADDELAAFTRAIANMKDSELKTALSALAEQVGNDLSGKKGGRAKENSSAAQLLRDTNKMMAELIRTPNDGEFKDDAQYQKHLKAKVNTFKHTFSSSGFAKFGKAIAAVVIALGSLIAGAVIGGGIGIAAGAWSGPGAVVTGVAGVFTGAATGAGIGLVAGATAVGITAGTVSGIFLFKKPSEAARTRHDLAKKVAEEAIEQAKTTTLKSG